MAFPFKDLTTIEFLKEIRLNFFCQKPDHVIKPSIAKIQALYPPPNHNNFFILRFQTLDPNIFRIIKNQIPRLEWYFKPKKIRY
jgi:hypothetical protein